MVDGLRAYAKRWSELTFGALTGTEWLGMLETAEQIARLARVPECELINHLDARCSSADIGGRLRTVIADRLHISPTQAGQRIKAAADLGPRQALTGEPLPPLLPHTAQARARGRINDEHLSVIRSFLAELPASIQPEVRAEAEKQLAKLAGECRPDELREDARALFDLLNQDGPEPTDDQARARKRGIRLGRQGADRMSAISGYVDPELRAVLEAIDAKLGAPGQCNRDDEHPAVDAAPSPEAARRDMRSADQRFHDALLAAGRAVLMSQTLGQHNGLPASIIVTTTLKELEAAAGRGLTGGGTILPMSDVIRLARHAHHYLAIFDQGKALALYHTKRLASPAQRLVLYAGQRGCTFPGCPVKGYKCEVHHLIPYALTGETDVNGLAWGCGQHHPLAEQGWTTQLNAHGEVEWIPPPHLDHGQRRTNRYHHPEKILYETGMDEPGDDRPD